MFCSFKKIGAVTAFLHTLELPTLEKTFFQASQISLAPLPK